ncbi:MAG TPA: hypothetical protein VHM65_06460, partial [Candidatus Lustribacter sp.]|nr:hypothetical protein [Candidatus Lustribacter sp.]
MSDIPGGYDGPLPPALPTVPGVEVSGLASAPGEPPSWAGVDLLTGASVRVRVLSAPADTVELDAARSHAARMTLVRPETVRDHLTRRHVVDLADGTSALVCDTVDGTSLADLLATRGALTAGETVTVLVPLLQIAGDLHAAGSAVGGVGPGQLLVTADGRPVLDVMGPTQESADPRLAAADDVRAVGELAWRLLGGHTGAGEGRPRRREDVLAQAGPVLGPALADALHRDPMRRPRADELLAGLFAAQAPEPLGLDGPPAGPSEVPLTRAERRRVSASAAKHALPGGAATSRPSVPAWVRRSAGPTRPMVPGAWVRPGALVLVGALVVAVVAVAASRMWPDPLSSPEVAAVRASATTASGTVAADPV